MRSVRHPLGAYAVLTAVTFALSLALSASNPPYAHPSQAELLRPASVLLALALGFGGVWLFVRSPFGQCHAAGAGVSSAIQALVLGALLGTAAAGLDATLGVSKTTAAALQVGSIHLPAPYSVLVYAAGAVVVESVLRLFPLGLLAYAAEKLRPGVRLSAAAFGTAAALLSLVEPATQLTLLAARTEILVVFGIFIYVYGLLACWQYWRSGPVAPVLMRLGSYAVWHVALGPLLAAA